LLLTAFAHRSLAIHQARKNVLKASGFRVQLAEDFHRFA
jgi:hypothetical protein